MRISDWSSDVCSSDLLDLFGGARRGLEASQARLQAAQASWDEARVTLAAEVADAYVQRRYCDHLLVLYQDTLDSRRNTERLTSLTLNAGFVAPADAAQASSGSYDSETPLTPQQGIGYRKSGGEGKDV